MQLKVLLVVRKKGIGVGGPWAGMGVVGGKERGNRKDHKFHKNKTSGTKEGASLW